jgi:hypothetical protein
VQLYLHCLNTASWRGAQLKYRDNFTFTLPLNRTENFTTKQMLRLQRAGGIVSGHKHIGCVHACVNNYLHWLVLISSSSDFSVSFKLWGSVGREGIASERSPEIFIPTDRFLACSHPHQ